MAAEVQAPVAFSNAACLPIPNREAGAPAAAQALQGPPVATPTWTCRKHGELPLERFTKSALQEHICKACVAERNRRHYKKRPEVYVASDARVREKKRAAVGSVLFSPEEAAAALHAFGKRCFLTGAEQPLTFIPIDGDLPLSVCNAVPVRRAVARLCGGVLPPKHRRGALDIASSIVPLDMQQME